MAVSKILMCTKLEFNLAPAALRTFNGVWGHHRDHLIFTTSQHSLKVYKYIAWTVPTESVMSQKSFLAKHKKHKSEEGVEEMTKTKVDERKARYSLESGVSRRYHDIDILSL